MNTEYSTSNPEGTWVPVIQSIFDRWQEVCGIQFVRITDGTNTTDNGDPWTVPISNNVGEVRIHTYASTAAAAAFARFPNNPFMPGSVSLNPAMIGQALSGGSTTLFFRNVLSHEIGHAIGIEHPDCAECYMSGGDPECTVSAQHLWLMTPGVSSIASVDGPQHDDIRAAQYLYGDAYEPNDSSIEAVDLGEIVPWDTAIPTPSALPPPALRTLTCETTITSLFDDADEDWYVFQTDSPLRTSIKVRPAGAEYQDKAGCPQDPCSTECTINSKEMIDLAVEILDSNLNVVYSDTATGLGQSKQVIDILLDGNEEYYVCVFGLSEAMSDQVQMYELQFIDPSCPADVNGDESVDIADLLDYLDAYACCENLSGPCSCSESDVEADFNRNGIVDEDDFDLFFAYYTNGC